MKKPLVSIIIPTYNRAHLIGQTLDSVLTQTYTNWECIIVDDGSTDKTCEIVKQYVNKDVRFKYNKRPENYAKGGNGARNYGFELSRGEYINWFDDDDIMLKSFLLDRINVIRNGLDIIIGGGYYCDDSLRIIKPMDLSINSSLFKDYVLWKIEVFTPSILFKRNFLIDKKLFDVNIVKGQEADFFSRVFFDLKKEQYKIVPTGLFLYRRHSETKSSKALIYNKKMQNDAVKIYLDNLEKSLLLKDKELIMFFYNRLIALWYRSFKYDDYENRKNVFKGLKRLLKKRNKFVLMKINVIFGISRLLNRRIWFLSNYLKAQKVNG